MQPAEIRARYGWQAAATISGAIPGKTGYAAFSSMAAASFSADSDFPPNILRYFFTPRFPLHLPQL